MSRLAHYLWAPMVLLFLATSLISTTTAKTPPSSGVSSEDKAKACNDAADRKGLKDQERQTFMQSCLNKAAETGSSANVSEQDKA
jgi:hypothetical protein